MNPTAESSIELCVNLCETAQPDIVPEELEQLVGQTCREAGFPYCERVYAGSYFCESYFCWMGDAFHESLRMFCERHDVRATLVVPLAGQSFLDRVSRRLDEVLGQFGSLYDEVVVNDVARFHDVHALYGKRIGLGRLFSKEMRDARVEGLVDRCAIPALSAEARECMAASRSKSSPPGALPPGVSSSGMLSSGDRQPIIELDPVANVVDVSAILAEEPQARIAMHLPFCFATTGRNCSAASIDDPIEEKFRLGRGCSLHCLRIDQDYRTEEGVRYLKQGRTFFFENPSCAIVGTPSWRIVYQAGMVGR